MTIGLLLGAGFSKWAVGLPVASELFDFAIDPWPGERAKLDEIVSLKREWDAAHPGGFAEQFIADSLASGGTAKDAVLWYLGRRLSEPFIWTDIYARRRRRATLMIDEHRKFLVPGVRQAQCFLSRFCGFASAGIVTTNYDLVVEYALGTRVFNYGLRYQRLTGRGAYPVSTWKRPVRLTGRLPIAKVHGSLSWDIYDLYTDGRRGLTGGALIVAPTADKKPPRELVAIWKLARAILHRARHLVVFGFSFNPYDAAVLELLADGGKRLESALVIDICPNTGRAEAVWPQASITACLPPPEGIIPLRTWWLQKTRIRRSSF